MLANTASIPSPAAVRSPWVFFALVFALTLPLWLISQAVEISGLLPDHLPITDALATFMPFVAAALLIYREEKWPGVKRLLNRAVDFHRLKSKQWWLPIIFMMPLLYFLTYGVMRSMGFALTTTWEIPPETPLLLLIFFAAAAGEELGYMGYAIEPLQARHGALTASLLMGVVWALWHYPSMIQIGQSPALMAWGTLATVAFRILYVWIFNNTGHCIFGVILFHAIANTGRSIFPGGRTAFELGNASIGYSIISLAAVVVVVLWESRTLNRFRFKREANA